MAEKFIGNYENQDDNKELSDYARKLLPITRYITLEDAIDRQLLATDIELIPIDDNTTIGILNSKRKGTINRLIHVLRRVEKALKDKLIKADAPWLSELENKMLRYTIYCADAEARLMIIESKGKETKQQLDENSG